MSAIRFLLLLLCLSLSPTCLSQTDAEALLAFKKSLFNPTQKLASWTPNSNPCVDKWEGVFCQDGKPIVNRLHLKNMGLSGTIDVDALAQIKNLITLSLANNSFSGPLPPFNKLNGLKALYLDSNKFSGEIVGDFFVGTTFRRIWLSQNEFSGKIPESLGQINGLLALHLEQNKFTGQIPEISQQTLNDLDFSGNQLEGEVPASMERFGDKAFKGNPGVCGKFMGSECKNDPTNGEAHEMKEPKKSNPKSTILIILAIVGVMVILLVFLFVFKSKNDDDDGDDFSVLGKEPVDDVVEVHVHGNTASGGGGGGGASKRSNSGGGDGGGGGGGSIGGGGGSSKKSGDSSQKGGSRKGSTSGKMGDLVVINEEKGIFGLADLMKASAEVLGNGALGSAYKAVMSNGVSVVVKRIKDMNNLGKDEFDTEIRKIGKLRHKNILTPLAYHYRKEEKLVVSEYVPKGSLLYVLHGDRGLSHAELNWPTRLKIIRGIASGLQYLHAEFSTNELPHGNLKSSNVLINDIYEPLLSDYAFLRMITPTQAAQGMFAYKSPEVVEGQAISPKCEVYCFGIIILEVLTGKFPSQYLNAGKGGTDVIQWVRSSIEDKKEAEILDPEIASATSSVDPMIQLLYLGAACCDNNPSKRPSMEEAFKSLEEIKA